MGQPATGITQNLGNRNRKKDRTAVRFSSVLWIFSVHRTEPANTIMEYLTLTDIMTDDTDVPKPAGTANFGLKWIAAHKGVTGNERVDEEAKTAAQGESSPPEELPPIL
jgi:hypothetical protein